MVLVQPDEMPLKRLLRRFMDIRCFVSIFQGENVVTGECLVGCCERQERRFEESRLQFFDSTLVVEQGKWKTGELNGLISNGSSGSGKGKIEWFNLVSTA